MALSDGTLIIPKARLSYPHIWDKGSYMGKENNKYSCTVLFPKGDGSLFKALHTLAKKTAVEHYGSADKVHPGIRQLLSDGAFGTNPYVAVKDGDVKGDEAYEGMWYMKASNDAMPSTYDLQRQEIGQESGLLYAGCFADVKVSFWIQDNEYAKRINANLLGLRFREHGDPLAGGSGRASADDFDDVGEAVGDEDDFGGL